MIAFRAKFDFEDKGITVTFPDFPEAVTCGFTEGEALEYAGDALQTVLSEYIKRRREIPQPKKASNKASKGMRMIPLPALAEAKLRLYQAMRERGVRKADLARRLGWHKSQVDRLLDLGHGSRLDQIEEALGALHKRLAIEVEDAPRWARDLAR